MHGNLIDYRTHSCAAEAWEHGIVKAEEEKGKAERGEQAVGQRTQREIMEERSE